MTEIKEGDELQLKSGGPGMTIRKIEADTARCDWFVDGKLYDGTFPLNSLKPAKKSGILASSADLRSAALLDKVAPKALREVLVVMNGSSPGL